MLFLSPLPATGSHSFLRLLQTLVSLSEAQSLPEDRFIAQILRDVVGEGTLDYLDRQRTNQMVRKSR